VRPEIADELVQQAAVRMLEADGVPAEPGLRAWLFRVTTNLALDYLRRHSTWRETILEDAKERADLDEVFIAESQSLRGSPEIAAIAHEHLAVCLSCTLRNLPPHQAVALLLREVYGFSHDEVAEMTDATFGQVKNWIHTARATLHARYQKTCALVTKEGVCYQCVELSEFFHGRSVDPLDHTLRDLDARLAILRDRRHTPLGPWHRIMMRLVHDVLDS
jgi:RNA polymerase sigma-70 factor (ECF subfamily)